MVLGLYKEELCYLCTAASISSILTYRRLRWTENIFRIGATTCKYGLSGKTWENVQLEYEWKEGCV
jgi:hypothetical protein